MKRAIWIAGMSVLAVGLLTGGFALGYWRHSLPAPPSRAALRADESRTPSPVDTTIGDCYATLDQLNSLLREANKVPSARPGEDEVAWARQTAAHFFVVETKLDALTVPTTLRSAYDFEHRYIEAERESLEAAANSQSDDAQTLFARASALFDQAKAELSRAGCL